MSGPENLSGGCACGAVHYETTVDPVLMLNCHCRACQQAGGSGYAPLSFSRKRGCSCTASFVTTAALATAEKRLSAAFAQIAEARLR